MPRSPGFPGGFPGGNGPKANPVNIRWPFLRAMALVRTAVPGSAFVSQVAIETLYSNPGVAARLSQETIEVLQRVGVVVVTGGVGQGHGGGHKAKVRIIEVGGLATARMAAPVIPGGQTVQAVAAKTTTRMAAPLEKVIEFAPASVATARMAAPAVSGGSGANATVQAVAALATAHMAAPAVSGSQPAQPVSGGSRIIRRPPVIKRPRGKSVTVYAEAAGAIALGGSHLVYADDTNLDDLDAEFTDFFKELLTLELIAA